MQASKVMSPAAGSGMEAAALAVAQSPVCVPPLDNIIQWLGLLVNAHMVNLAMLPEAREVCLQTHNFIVSPLYRSKAAPHCVSAVSWASCGGR